MKNKKLLFAFALAAMTALSALCFASCAKDQGNETVDKMNKALNSANISADNTAEEAFNALKAAGFDVAELNAAKDGHLYVWEKTSDKIVYVNAEEDSAETDGKDGEYWVAVSEKTALDAALKSKTKFNFYIVGNLNADINLSYTSSVIVASGGTIFGNVTLGGTDGAQAVVHGDIDGNLTVANVNASVSHYGTVNDVTLGAVSQKSYVEQGTVRGTLTVAEGNVVLEKDAYVPSILITDTQKSVNLEINSAKTAVMLKAEVSRAESESDEIAANVKIKMAKDVTLYVDAADLAKVCVWGEGGNGKYYTLSTLTDGEQRDEALGENAKIYVAARAANEEQLHNALEKGGYVIVTEDFEITSVVEITSSVLLDGGGHKLTAAPAAQWTTSKRSIWIDNGGVEVAIKNLTVDANKVSERGVQVNTDVTDVKLTIDNCNISATMYGINVCNGADVDLLMTNTTVTAWGALNLWSAQYRVKVVSCVLNGVNDKTYNKDGWNDFATVCLEGDTTQKTTEHSSVIDVQFEDTTITAASQTGNRQFLVGFNTGAAENTVSLVNCKLLLDQSGNTYRFYDSGEGNSLVIDGKPAEIETEIEEE